MVSKPIQGSCGVSNDVMDGRPRKLLMNRAEIAELKDKSEREGCALVPIKIYLNDRHLVRKEGSSRSPTLPLRGTRS